MWVASSSLFPAVAIYTLWKQKPFGYTFPYCLQVNCSKQQYVYNWRRALVSFNQRRRLSTTRFWLRKYFFLVLYNIEMIKVYASNSHATRCSKQNKHTVYRELISKQILLYPRHIPRALKAALRLKSRVEGPKQKQTAEFRETNQPRETSRNWIELSEKWIEWKLKLFTGEAVPVACRLRQQIISLYRSRQAEIAALLKNKITWIEANYLNIGK